MPSRMKNSKGSKECGEDSLENVVIIGSGQRLVCRNICRQAQLKPLVFEGAITEENRMAGPCH